MADFGLAKAKSQLRDGKEPVSGGYTLRYCPKEQTERSVPEAWMDIYAWALTVLEMLAWKWLKENGATEERIAISGYEKV